MPEGHPDIMGSTAQRLYRTCVRFFRHLSQKLLDRCQPAALFFIQSDEKIDCASPVQSLCSVAYVIDIKILIVYNKIGKKIRRNSDEH